MERCGGARATGAWSERHPPQSVPARHADWSPLDSCLLQHQVPDSITHNNMADDEAKRAKQADIDRKRAEVRKRLEETAKAKKAKKGFMTPERKKKLRLLLRKKAAEELKKEQERKAAERRRIIDERCGKPKNIDDANEDTIKRVLRDYHARISTLEDEKFDLEYAVKKKDFEISDLNAQVNDLRGKL
ncbi:troponin I-like isoform X6 [Zootermopsis nevadensis]|uniref:Troponin I n=1 Tax=Zootermopsis nevadensis TaxID=136037 RepID=A0A067RSH0_ZOONE|nr:troponin I-like isoform X6 [Zootermopsis nevadensis]KDR22759.1 Troponin I [Zootermopsis nevadensis]